ncbi:MAG: 3D-(3,5/4)-trihydroxycyclohexane-1,2-dione acylhydrolase (decyclizing) [Brevinema sp.]
MKLTTAQALIRYLDNQYIEIDGKEIKFVHGISAIFGHGCVLGIGEAMESSKHSLKFFQGKHEQGQGQVALGFAKQSNRRRIMACASSIGPGAANMVTAAATATANHIPVLFLPGDIYATRQPDPALQQIEHPHDYTITTSDAFKAVCRYFDRIQRPEQLMTAAQNAMRVLTDQANTGAVCLALPQDVQGEAYDYPEEFFQKRVHHIARQPLEDSAVKRIVELLKGKKKPVIISGGGTRFSEAHKELLAFATEFNIPITTTQAGKGVVTWENPYDLGSIGLTGTLCANKIAKNADCIIALGTRLNDFHTSSKTGWGNDVPIININLNAMDAYKMNSHPFQADIKTALVALTKELRQAGYKSSYKDEIATAKKEWETELARLSSLNEGGIWQSAVIGYINQHCANDAIIVTASGSLPSDLERMWKVKSLDTYHAEYAYSCMGAEVALALGAKMAEPSKEVYCFIGDGGYVMSHSELLTSIQEGMKINIVLIDNHGFQCIHNLQNNNGSPDYGCEFRFKASNGRLDGEYLPVDYAMNAKSYGAEGRTVVKWDELPQAFAESVKSTKTNLIDIKCVVKSMTEGYETWWNAGVAEVSPHKSVMKASEERHNMLQKARKY